MDTSTVTIDADVFAFRLLADERFDWCSKRGDWLFSSRWNGTSAGLSSLYGLHSSTTAFFSLVVPA